MTFLSMSAGLDVVEFSVGVFDRDLVVGLVNQQAGEDVAGFCFHDPGLVVHQDRRAGIENGFVKLAFVQLRADGGQGGADHVSFVADLMTVDAVGALVLRKTLAPLSALPFISINFWIGGSVLPSLVLNTLVGSAWQRE